MRVFLSIIAIGSVLFCVLNTDAREFVDRYAKMGISGVSAMVDMAKGVAASDIERCQSGNEGERRECLKAHEAPLDKFDSRMDTAGQQDALYRAMK